jgi:hypothetical protein
MLRLIYKGLVWLHPPAFRERFGEELLWIFDEARREQGASSLFADGAVSVARQWAFGSNLWVWFLALLGGLIPILAGFGSFIPMLDFPIR